MSSYKAKDAGLKRQAGRKRQTDRQRSREREMFSEQSEEAARYRGRKKRCMSVERENGAHF